MAVLLTRKNFIKRLVSACVIFSFLMVMVAFADADIVAINAGKNVVYQNISADDVIGAYGKNVQTHNGKNLAVVGRITDASADGFTFYLRPAESASAVSIRCTFNRSVSLYSMIQHTLIDEETDNPVLFKVLGKITSSDKELSMSVEYVYVSDGVASDDLWSVKGSEKEEIFDSKRTYYRSIEYGNRGKVMQYNIPREWAKVEEKLPNVDGYQYRLNLLDRSAAPESIFIFYVDNNHLRNTADKDKTEKFNDAIVHNIRGDGKIVTRSNYDQLEYIKDLVFKHEIVRQNIQTDYGTLTYYETDFKDDNNNEFSQHRVEFIFLPRENEEIGPKVVLYVYPIDGPSEAHKSEILYVLRSMFM